ncbi:mucin-3A-like [Apteryx mantelli]|uniref:Mucin-3A-like n=1 Tax=Apteryx mantelli TaxID=2696672 RepID=A0ABM4G1P4_9AVES
MDASPSTLITSTSPNSASTILTTTKGASEPTTDTSPDTLFTSTSPTSTSTILTTTTGASEPTTDTSPDTLFTSTSPNSASTILTTTKGASESTTDTSPDTLFTSTSPTSPSTILTTTTGASEPTTDTSPSTFITSTSHTTASAILNTTTGASAPTTDTTSPSLFTSTSLTSPSTILTTTTGASEPTTDTSPDTLFTNTSPTSTSTILTTTTGASEPTTDTSPSTVISPTSATTTVAADTTRTTVKTTTRGPCYNEGTWINGHCQCLPGFIGDKCEFAENTFDAKVEVNGTVRLEVRVTNREFTSDFRDNNSSAYHDFVQKFTEQINNIYKNIAGYQGIEILRLIPGSIVVDHNVIISLMVTSQTQDKLRNISIILQEEIRAVAAQQNCTDSTDELCFNSSVNVVDSGSFYFDNELHCRQITPEKYQDFYFPNLTSSGLFCMSNCTTNTLSTIDCNYGQCHVTSTGPQCFCRETNIYWYQGNRCKTRISKIAVGLGLAVAVLVAVIFILAGLLFRARRTKSFGSASALRATKKWYEDMYEDWSFPGSFSFWNEGATAVDTQVDLESVDTSAPVQIPRPESISTQL